jgi:peptidoglycan/LPS O-acetylase OafA/YrhL
MLFGSGFVLIALLAVSVWAIVEAFTAEPERVRVLPKAVWIIVILLLLPIGAVFWFLFGRPRKALSNSRVQRPGTWGPARSAPQRRAAPIAPDDDPEFLLRLREQMRNKPDDDPRA